MLSLPRPHLKKPLTEEKTNCMGGGCKERVIERTLLILQDAFKKRGREGFPTSTTLQEWLGLNVILLCLSTVITFAYQVRERNHCGIALSWHTAFSDPFSFVYLLNYFCHRLLELSVTPAARQDAPKQEQECFGFSYELVLVQMTWKSVFPVFSVFPAPIKVNFQMTFCSPCDPT